MRLKKMQLLELIALVYFIMRSGYLGVGLSGYLRLSKNNAYLCPFLGGILGLFPLSIFLKLGNLLPEKNINDMLQFYFPKIGKGISFLLMLFVFFFTIVMAWDLNNFIASEYLFNTPLLPIVIGLLIPIIYLLTKGIETLGRASIILGYISIFLFFLSIIGLTSQVKISNVLPFLEHGPIDVIKGAMIYLSYSVLPLFLLLIIPKEKWEHSKHYNRAIIGTYLFVCIILTLISFIIIGVLGIDLATLYQYPDYHVLRRISIGNFIQRIETLLAIQWIISLFLLISFSIYYILNTCFYLFPVKKQTSRTSLIFLISTLILYLSTIIFSNNALASNFTTFVFPYGLILFFFILPGMVYYRIRRYKKDSP